MNKIIRRSYPVERLPEDLRNGFAPGISVKVTIEDSTERNSLSFEDLIDAKGTLVPSDDDPVERIRKLRDEWD